MSDELRRAFYATSVNSLDFDSYIPDLHGITEILTEDHRKQLCRHLPARAEGECFCSLSFFYFYDWRRLKILKNKKNVLFTN